MNKKRRDWKNHVIVRIDAVFVNISPGYILLNITAQIGRSRQGTKNVHSHKVILIGALRSIKGHPRPPPPPPSPPPFPMTSKLENLPVTVLVSILDAS